MNAANRTFFIRQLALRMTADSPKVLNDHLLHLVFVNRDETVARYRDIESRPMDMALDVAQSRTWLAGRAREFDVRASVTDDDESVA